MTDAECPEALKTISALRQNLRPMMVVLLLGCKKINVKVKRTEKATILHSLINTGFVTLLYLQ